VGPARIHPGYGNTTASRPGNGTGSAGVPEKVIPRKSKALQGLDVAGRQGGIEHFDVADITGEPVRRLAVELPAPDGEGAAGVVRRGVGGRALECTVHIEPELSACAVEDAHQVGPAVQYRRRRGQGPDTGRLGRVGLHTRERPAVVDVRVLEIEGAGLGAVL